eukprot:GFYU01002943.1.p1 GENE.GFYU01002943.1~~GFYU01002943.1.p1  ORF type:complete len:157 (-),score=43.27 GFYU01002943.1:214-684(-)
MGTISLEVTLLERGDTSLSAGGVDGEGPKRQRHVLRVLNESGVEVGDSLARSEEEVEREQQLIVYFQGKLGQYLSQAQASEHNCGLLQARIQSLEGEMRGREHQLQESRHHLEDARGEVSRLTEDMQVTRDNYDAQMKLLTEHICALQEEMASKER